MIISCPGALTFYKSPCSGVLHIAPPLGEGFAFHLKSLWVAPADLSGMEGSHIPGSHCMFRTLFSNGGTPPRPQPPKWHGIGLRWNQGLSPTNHPPWGYLWLTLHKVKD